MTKESCGLGVNFGILELWKRAKKSIFHFHNWVHFGSWDRRKVFRLQGECENSGAPKFVEFAPLTQVRHFVPKFTDRFTTTTRRHDGRRHELARRQVFGIEESTGFAEGVKLLAKASGYLRAIEGQFRMWQFRSTTKSRSANGAGVARQGLPATGVMACVNERPRPSVAAATSGTCHPEFPDGLHEL